MTDEEMRQLENWQQSYEGNLDMAIHDLGDALDILDAATCHRDGVRMLKAERDRLVRFEKKLSSILNCAQPPAYIITEAAE